MLRGETSVYKVTRCAKQRTRLGRDGDGGGDRLGDGYVWRSAFDE